MNIFTQNLLERREIKQAKGVRRGKGTLGVIESKQCYTWYRTKPDLYIVTSKRSLLENMKSCE